MANPISISGRVFMKGGARWSPKGLCYQPVDDIDPISDNNLSIVRALLAEDGNWTKLGINALRIYQVDPTASHDQVMALLAEKQIYVEIGCVNSAVSLPRDGSYPCYVLDRVKAVVDTFHKYDNVLSFSVSNELLDKDQPDVAAADKALARDTKAYIVQQNYRKIPVGMALRDDSKIRTPEAAHFYACGNASDYIDYNEYRWCDYTSPNSQGSMDAWYDLYKIFEQFPVPVVFGEYGCNSGNNRNWRQVPYLFGAKKLKPTNAGEVTMSDVVSGGFAFRYIQHKEENLGLVDTSGNPIGGHGFEDLCQQYKAVSNFSASSVNGSDPLPCSSDYNPPVPASCGNTPPSGPTISIKVTNEISPATTVNWSYTNDLNLGPNTKWIDLAKMNAGSSPVQINVPKSAAWLSIAYQSDQNWYGGCRISITNIKDGDTVHGQWVNNGQGDCPLN